jgi:hypothetical protein
MRKSNLLFIALCCIGCTQPNTLRPENAKETIEYLNVQNLSLKEKEALVKQLNSDKSKFPYYQTIDTLAYLKEINLQIEVNLISDTIRQKLDTFTLQYMAYACHCPQWVPIDSIAKNRPDLDGCYVKPATFEISLPNVLKAGTRVTFIGRVEDNRPFTYVQRSDSIPGKKLYYYSYKVHKPYTFWGERVFESYDIHLIEDTIRGHYLSREITVY